MLMQTYIQSLQRLLGITQLLVFWLLWKHIKKRLIDKPQIFYLVITTIHFRKDKMKKMQ